MFSIGCQKTLEWRDYFGKHYGALLMNATEPLPAHIVTGAGHKFPWYVRLFLANQRRRYGREL